MIYGFQLLPCSNTPISLWPKWLLISILQNLLCQEHYEDIERHYGTLYQNCGRQFAFDKRGQRRLIHLCLKNPRATATQIQQELGPAGDYDINTIRRHLRKAGCKTIKPASRPLLNRTQ